MITSWACSPRYRMESGSNLTKFAGSDPQATRSGIQPTLLHPSYLVPEYRTRWPALGDTYMQATILLIDDNAVQAATRQTILKRAGYFVIPVLHPQQCSQLR